MSNSILITGGAGFIGSHLADEMLCAGCRVRALDSLIAQVHERGERPGYLDDDVELIVGDVRDADCVRRALDGVDAVVHLAARVGVGQSMYDIAEYTSVNGEGTATLLQVLLDHPVKQLVVASSMSVYGEGLYADAGGRVVDAAERTREQLERGEWDPVDAGGRALAPLPTPEDKPPSLSSIYALGKFDQERMCLLFGSAYGVPVSALRFFNVYGPRQALSNPYTGVLAIFAGRLLNERAPLIYEDGRQRRDFVSVYDVARACRQSLERPDRAGRTLNVGSGESVSVLEIADELAAVMGCEQIAAQVTGKYRVGDIRNCFADISRAGDAIGYRPQVARSDGMAELADWLAGEVATDRVDDAAAELAARGLTV
ncbi:MAG TPA: NAD-dependent epimerase/dehydratase family protein [Solirubrobacteraceae bacterium]|nr:NAD-dependent epimerase/dehydratase family protein [Solirubrobacteraceae bacterium]